MNGDAPRFLPDRLRPPVSRRRSRRGLVLLSVVPLMLLAVPQWRIREVQIDGCPKLPRSAELSLKALVGQPTLDLDLEEIRNRVQVWPGIGEVQVALELPGTLIVRAELEKVMGSVRIGRSWHGVDEAGGLTGSLDVAVAPVLERFESDGDRRRALSAAVRLESSSGARVVSIRRITPADYQAVLVMDGEDTKRTVHLHPQGTVAESAWCAALAKGAVSQAWADVRWSDRMVVGRGQ